MVDIRVSALRTKIDVITLDVRSERWKSREEDWLLVEQQPRLEALQYDSSWDSYRVANRLSRMLRGISIQRRRSSKQM